MATAADAGIDGRDLTQAQIYILELKLDNAHGTGPTIHRIVLDPDVLRERLTFILLQRNLHAIIDKVIASLNRTITIVNKKYGIECARISRYTRDLRIMGHLAIAPVQDIDLRTWLLFRSVRIHFEDDCRSPARLPSIVEDLDREIWDRIVKKLKDTDRVLARKIRLLRTWSALAACVDHAYEGGYTDIQSMADLWNRAVARIEAPVPALTGFIRQPPRDQPSSVMTYTYGRCPFVPLWSDGNERTFAELTREASEAMGPWPSLLGALTKGKKARTV